MNIRVYKCTKGDGVYYEMLGVTDHALASEAVYRSQADSIEEIVHQMTEVLNKFVVLPTFTPSLDDHTTIIFAPRCDIEWELSKEAPNRHLSLTPTEQDIFWSCFLKAYNDKVT